MAAAAQPVVLPAGEFFYREADTFPHFAIVASGDIRVYKADAQGHEVTLYHVIAGEACIVNLTAVLLGRGAIANARAEAFTSAFAFPAAMLDPWMAASTGLRRFVFDAMAARMAGVMSLVGDIAFRPVDSRLASLLLERFTHERVIEATHEQIAAELGTAREVVSRVLRGLARRGAVQAVRGRIVLRDAEVLRQVI